jgi:DNA-binding MarR family transcriptional regulator
MRTVHDSLTVSEQRVLRLVAHDEPLFGAAAEQLTLTAGAATNARKQLVAHGHLHEDASELVDPLLADWFRRTLPCSTLRLPRA